MIVDILLHMLTALYGGVGMGAVSAVEKSFETYSSTAYNVAVTINSMAVKPVAAVVLSGMLLLEFARISSKVEGDHKLGVQLIGITFFKAGFIILMIQHTEMIVRGLNGVGMELIKNATKGEAGAAAGKAVEESMRAALKDLGITEQLALLPILFLPWLLSIAAVIVIPIVVMMRFLELYVLTAGASLPLVFLANQETKSMGVGYLRKLLVAILHGFTLIIAVKIYAAFQADSLNAAPSLKELFANFNIVVLLQNMGLLILGQIMLIVVVMAAGRFAKAFVGE